MANQCTCGGMDDRDSLQWCEFCIDRSRLNEPRPLVFNIIKKIIDENTEAKQLPKSPARG